MAGWDGDPTAATSGSITGAMLDAERHIATVYPPGSHGFPPDARDAAYAFADQVLRAKGK